MSLKYLEPDVEALPHERQRFLGLALIPEGFRVPGLGLRGSKASSCGTPPLSCSKLLHWHASLVRVPRPLACPMQQTCELCTLARLMYNVATSG